MSLNSLPNSLRQALNRAQPGSIGSMLRTLAFGDVMRMSLPVALRAQHPLGVGAANPYVVQTGANSLALPEDAKALNIVRAWARAGTGTPAALTIDADAATAPAAGHCKVSPNGDLLFNSTDAWTSVDVTYQPEKADVIELTLPVVTGTLTIPTQLGPAVRLIEAESLVGTHTGKFAITAPAAGPNATTLTARLDNALLTVLFDNADDAVTSARVKLLMAAAVDVNALLEAASVQQ
jgi:hypothetical protein